MSRFALKEEAEGFGARVAALVAPRRARGWRGQVERLWADVQARGMADKTDATRKLYASRLRKAVRDALAAAEPDEKRRARLEEALMDVVRIDRAVLSRLQADYQARVRAGNADLVLVPDWERLLAAFRLMLASPDMELRAVALMALTGRRFEEVLRAGRLAPSQDRHARGALRHRWLLDFSGQLKTGGGAATMAGRTFRIPTLAPAAGVLAAFEGMRESEAGRAWMAASTRQLSTTHNPQLNARLRASPAAAFWPEGAPLTLKELRALYAEVAYASFAPRTTRAPYFAAILGHRPDDLSTALSYMRFSLSEAARREGQEEMNRLTLLRDQQREQAIAAKDGKAHDDGPEGAGHDGEHGAERDGEHGAERDEERDGGQGREAGPRPQDRPRARRPSRPANG